MRAAFALLWTVTLCGVGGVAPARWAPAHAAAAVQTTEGTIDSVGTEGLTLTSAAGTRVQVKTTAETFVLDRLPARLEDIQVGDVIAITVPPGAEVHRLVLIAPGDLRAGMRVTVRGSANADGSVTASSVTVEGPVR